MGDVYFKICEMSNPGVLPSLVKDQTKTVLVPEEWTALPAIKGRPTFQVGALNNLTMDTQRHMAHYLLFRVSCCVKEDYSTPMFSGTESALLII